MRGSPSCSQSPKRRQGKPKAIRETARAKRRTSDEAPAAPRFATACTSASNTASPESRCDGATARRRWTSSCSRMEAKTRTRLRCREKATKRVRKGYVVSHQAPVVAYRTSRNYDVHEAPVYQCGTASGAPYQPQSFSVEMKPSRSKVE